MLRYTQEESHTISGRMSQQFKEGRQSRDGQVSKAKGKAKPLLRQLANEYVDCNRSMLCLLLGKTPEFSTAKQIVGITSQIGTRPKNPNN